MNENTKILKWLLLPGFGCWSQDQTTALLGKTNEGERINHILMHPERQGSLLVAIHFSFNSTDISNPQFSA
jgi:hypothetical protein